MESVQTSVNQKVEVMDMGLEHVSQRGVLKVFQAVLSEPVEEKVVEHLLQEDGSGLISASGCCEVYRGKLIDEGSGWFSNWSGIISRSFLGI